jgi:LuxR family maltose regulon positive regulatory protein
VSDTLLATKIRIPPLHANLVKRPHLIERLNEGILQNHCLTLISAPAGYGKSTLLCEWVSQLNTPVAWLSLEKGENNPARFWSYFITALSTIPHLHQSGIADLIPQSFQSRQPPSMEILLENLLNDLSQLKVRAALVLDDLHVIAEGQIHKDLVFLIDHLPLSASGLHLVVASRMDPPWPLARYRVRDELTEVRTKDLRFSPIEAATFLNSVMGMKLSFQDIAHLDQRTEGWIAGLQMAALSLQGRGDVVNFLASFSGSHRFVLDYLTEEVLNQQKPEVLNFLLYTSILEHLTAPLCDAVNESTNSQELLVQLEKSNIFLVPMDDERQWYHYHHLFADLLRRRLTQTQPEFINKLHLRASSWYAQNNFLAEAISHALDAGDLAQVNKCIAGNAPSMVEHAKLMDVLRYFEKIPEEQIYSRPWLCVAFAWVKAHADPSGGMDQIIQQSEQCVNAVEDALERQRLSSNLAAIRAYLAWIGGSGEKALLIVREALETLPEDEWVIRCHLLNTQGSVLQYIGRLDESIQSYEAAIVAGQRTGRPQDTFFANSNLANVILIQGHLHDSFSILQHVLSIAGASRQAAIYSPVLAHIYATMSVVQLEWNEVKSAVSSARQGVALADEWKQVHALHYALLCLARALCAAGDFEGAFETNHRSICLAENVSSGFFRLSACDEIWFNLVSGNTSRAIEKYKELDPLVEQMDNKGRFLVTKASLLYALGQFTEVISALGEPICEYEQRGEYWFLLNLLPLQALALYGLGREEEALGVINHCLTLAEPEGYVRIFVERGTPMLRLLQATSHHGIHTEHINKLLPAFKIDDTSQRQAVPKIKYKGKGHALLEPLSERELQVLCLLDSSLTSAQIGRELYLSVNTVRTHIRNIYSKLAVHGRIEAIQTAKECALI